MGVTDRLYVMRDKEISACFSRHEYSEKNILNKAFPEN